jgi:hypothetical protein
LLIDRTHLRWSALFVAGSAASLGLYAYLSRHQPGGWAGGSAAGVRFGVAGAALMVFAMLLTALRKVPSWWWIGSRQAWLRGHIWLGLLSGVLILCHSGFRWGGPLERVLWVVFALTLATGVLGLALQQFLPRLLTQRVPCETPYEQIPLLCRRLGREAELVAEAVRANPKLPAAGRAQFHVFYEEQVRPFLTGPRPARCALMQAAKADELFSRMAAAPGAQGLADELAKLRTFCTERRYLAEQERLQLWLHVWLYAHVPLSAALLILGAAHALMASFY